MSLESAKPGVRPPSIEEIKSRYFIEDAWRDEQLPGAPARSCKSPFREDRHASFSIWDEGRRWKDQATGEHGDVLDFLARARDCSATEALAVARERLGWTPSGQGPAMTRLARPPRPWQAEKKADAPVWRARIMSDDVRTAWEAGLYFLSNDAGLLAHVDSWRGWPTGTAKFLADQRLLSAPEWKGRRGLAWIVQWPGLRAWREVGFHLRFDPRREGERAMWIYEPAGVGMPAVPLILGDFARARLVVILEGEWDATTFAAAAGWLESGASWPDKICVVGIRGATGWKPFLEHWRKSWPIRARFLVIPDNDEAGRKWHTEFVGELTKLAVSVVLLPLKADGPKDFNDLHRARPFARRDIYALLQGNGLVDGRGIPL